MEDKDTTKNKRAKIIVSSEDELTDLLRKISALEDQNILLTFAEESDLLISPINLKVLQEVCDDLNKNLILQIIQNSNGIRNAKIADCVTTSSPSEVDEELWLAAENQKRDRKEKLEKSLKGKPKEAREAIQNLSQGEEPVLQDSEYQKRVQEVISKAKNLTNKDNSQVIQEDGFIFAVGEEIDPTEEKKDGKLEKKEGALVGKNFTNMSNLRNVKGEPTEEKKKKEPIDKKKLKKGLIIFLLVALLSLGGASAFAYFTLPLVQAEIYIESKAIEVERTFKGDSDTKNFSISEGTIPIKKEIVEVNRSDHAEATGEGRRGSKAEGIVLLKYWDGDEVTIPSGTTLTTTFEGEDLQFEISTDVLLPEAPNTTSNIAVRATEPGDEYNIDQTGLFFSVEGFSDDELTGENNNHFSGGSSETYQKLTQADYDNLLKELRKDAFEEGLERLEERLPDWEILEDTIEQGIVGNVDTDIPVGGEGNMFNMSITTETEALFFNKDEILQSREEIIKQAAIENNLFESDEDLSLELDPEIETEINIEEIDGDSVVITFKAKGNIRPKVDTQEIENSLLGKSWEEGTEILKNIRYSDKEAKVEFLPEYFPAFLRHFPNREGRVLVETELLETEVVKDEAEAEEEEEEQEEPEE